MFLVVADVQVIVSFPPPENRFSLLFFFSSQEFSRDSGDSELFRRPTQP